MKALATQRLMDQVSALEKDVDELTLVAPVRHVYTVVVDVTAFLDDLPKIKKWANLVLDTRQRDQSAIVQVIVPLNAIDVLDQFKKGTDKANVHARESIRYLDQQLLRQAHETTAAAATAPPLPTHSFLRTQKMAETLDGWDKVAAFWIGETSRRSTQLMSDDDDNDKNERNGRIHTPDTVDDDNDTDNDDENDDPDADPSENAASAEEEDIVDWQDVPKKHRAVLNCFLYQFKQQQQPLDPKTDQPEHHVTLVTNDEQLAWWAELFGDPASGQRVQVHSVKEYDRLLGAMIYTKPSSKRQRHRQRRTS
ncbi:hypothetical protein BC940DRAFT_230276 [Gongronella butleri]|nr:hypothetical protein BC940DRAFT_230276 [Gongronella butleri]